MGLFDVGDDPMGGPMVTPTEMLDPSMAPPFDLGMPQQSSPILTEPREDGGGWQRALMLLMPALLAGVAGPKRPIGQGLAQVAGYMPQLMLQRERMQQQQQQYEAVNAYRQQQIAMREQAEQRQRDTLAQKALTTIGEQVGKFEDRDAYDKYIERTGQTFAMAGYARLGAEQLRRMYPFRPPDTATLAEKALKLYYEQPVVKRRLEKEGPTALINDVITLGKGKDAQRVPVLEAHKLAGQELKVGDDAGIKLEDLQQWPAAVLSAKQQFFDEKKRAPTEADNPEVFERARSLMQNKDEATAQIDKRLKELAVSNAELSGDLKRQQLAQGSNRPLKPPTGMERRALGFFNRAKQADEDVEALEAEVSKMGLLGEGRMRYAPNLAQTDTGQAYNQAQRAFTEARLRKDSGAAIPPHEYENDRRTYFVQPGDRPAVVAQKRRARAALLTSLAAEAGRALPEHYGDDAEALMQAYKDRAVRPDQATRKGALDQLKNRGRR